MEPAIPLPNADSQGPFELSWVPILLARLLGRGKMDRVLEGQNRSLAESGRTGDRHAVDAGAGLEPELDRVGGTGGKESGRQHQFGKDRVIRRSMSQQHRACRPRSERDNGIQRRCAPRLQDVELIEGKGDVGRRRFLGCGSLDCWPAPAGEQEQQTQPNAK